MLSSLCSNLVCNKGLAILENGPALDGTQCGPGSVKQGFINRLISLF